MQYTSEHDVAVFFRAIYDNNTAKISDFLHDGFDINAMNKNGENAVNAAIASGSYYVLQFLIDNVALIVKLLRCCWKYYPA
mgnify:CR=1 FL=1